MAHSNFVVARKKIQLLIYLIYFTLLPFPTTKYLYLAMEDSILEQNDGCSSCDIPGTNTPDKFFDDSDRLLEVPLKPRTFILSILDKIIENITLIHANLLTKHLFLPYLFSRALASSLPLSEHSYNVQQWAMRLRILDK